MEAGNFYHIYNHANGSENLFRNDENYNFFLRKWSQHIEPIADSYAYCLMPNHFHFLVRIKDEEDLEKLDQVFKTCLISYPKNSATYLSAMQKLTTKCTIGEALYSIAHSRLRRSRMNLI